MSLRPSVTGQTATSYAASRGLQDYKAANGIKGGVSAGQLNKSLSSTPLTPAKAGYLTTLVSSNVLSSAKAAEVAPLLVPPKTVVTEKAATSTSSRPTSADKPLAPVPATRIPLAENTTILVAAFRCDGFSAGCQNGGSFGTTGAISIGPKRLCWDCAIRYLGIQDESPEEQLKTIGGFDPKMK